MRSPSLAPSVVVLAATAFIVGCESGGYPADPAPPAVVVPPVDCVGANDCPLGSYCSEFGRCVESPVLPDAGTTTPPPENERETRAPASGDRYVYVAMTDLDTVARIDSETLDITTVPTGDQPRTIATAPGQDLAVVLNHGSDSVTIIRTDDGVDAVTTLPTLPRLNRLEMDPLGRHALAFFELTAADAVDVGSFQDVVVVDLAEGAERATSVSVGFRPRAVVFHPDGTQAYVHTDDGVSIVDLAAEGAAFVAPLVPLSGAAFGDEPLADHQPVEVVIARDGSRAFARFAGKSVVRAVSLADGSWVDVALAAPPSDIDLTADGSKLVAVVPEATTPGAPDDAGVSGDDAGASGDDAGGFDDDAGATDDDAGPPDGDAGAPDDDAGAPDEAEPPAADAGLVAADAGSAGADAGSPAVAPPVVVASLVVVPLPAGLVDAAAVVAVDCAPLAPGLVELTSDGARAIVFTNAVAEKAIGVVDLAAASLAVVPLRKAVGSVVVSPDDAMVVVVHNKVPGDPLPTQTFEEQLQHRHGFSIVDLDSRFAKLELTDARPGPLAFSVDEGDATHVHVVVADAAIGLKDVVAVDLRSLVATAIPMNSHPTGIGAVPSSGQVFVAQRHDMGRMSFIAVADREVRTVTGFQLNSQITE